MRAPYIAKGQDEAVWAPRKIISPKVKRNYTPVLALPFTSWANLGKYFLTAWSLQTRRNKPIPSFMQLHLCPLLYYGNFHL